VTQPDRPAGRGLRPAAGAVASFAQSRGLPVFQPETLKSNEAEARMRAARPDVVVVAAYGLILPPPLLAIAVHGAINIHASLLPRWRGAAPIQRALLAGDAETGVSIMQMDAGLDTGPLLSRRAIAIAPDDDAGSLHDKLAELGGEEIVVALSALERGDVARAPQPSAGVTYAAKLGREETWLDWRRRAIELERAVRAFRPAPGAIARLAGEPVKLWRSRVVPGEGVPGTVLNSQDALTVACGEAALALEEMQRAGGRRMSAPEFLRGHPVQPGMRLG
jgi:methionyl-tRNA formyltransferase